jgi:acetoin utilization deacetylase AcuC-like enzyme
MGPPALRSLLLRPLRRLRQLAGLAPAPRAAFVWSRDYRLELPGVAADPGRSERILAALVHAGLVDPAQVLVPTAVSYQQLQRIHSATYIDSLTRPEALTRVVGLRLPDPLPDRVIAVQRAMAGGTLLAARTALVGGGGGSGVAVNLGGGFHHAFAERGERFCVFNDVAVAIADLRADGFREPVLVVDLDLHDGDGTRAIFAGDPSVHSFSIHNQTNASVPVADTVANTTLIELGGGVDDATYLAAVRGHLPGLLARVRPALVFYLAGNDPAADDAIGDWRISAAGLLARDQAVVAAVRDAGRRLPLAVVLAGGYGPRAWSYSARFFSWLLSGRAVEPPSNEELTLSSYRALARTLAPHELTGDGGDGAPGGSGADDWGLTAEDLAGAGGLQPRSRFLGFYSRQGIELALGRAGLIERLRQRGYPHPFLELELDNPGGETLRLWGDPRRRDILMELRVRIDRHTVPDLAFLRIEWLLLQNPRAHFTRERPRLPGQRFPGLGILPDVMALNVLACERLRLDGILFVPSHFHTACQGRRLLRFVDPADEGRFRAVESALCSLPLAAATHAIDQERVVDAAGEPFRWRPMPMVLPVSERLKERLAAPAYEAAAAAAAATGPLHLVG